jgi:hypothetical protein
MNNEERKPMEMSPIQASRSANSRSFIERAPTESGMTTHAANKAAIPMTMPTGPIPNAGSSRQPM